MPVHMARRALHPKKRRWDTKKRQYIEQHREEWVAVAEWWRNAVLNQRIFALGQYEQGKDFKGPLPWPNEITLKAAHHEFTLVTGVAMTRLAFAAKFRKVAGVHRVGQMNPARFVMTVSYDISSFRRNQLTDILRHAKMGTLEIT